MGLYSSDDIEAAQIDTIDEHLRDVKKDYQDAKELGPLAVEQWFLLSLPKWMAGLEGCLSESGFAVGSKLSWADVEIFTFVTTFLGHREGAFSPCGAARSQSEPVVAPTARTQCLPARMQREACFLQTSTTDKERVEPRCRGEHQGLSQDSEVCRVDQEYTQNGSRNQRINPFFVVETKWQSCQCPY